MKKMIILTICLIFANKAEKQPLLAQYTPLVEKVAETQNNTKIRDVSGVEELIGKVPTGQRCEFINVLADFADKRGFDWKWILLLMYNESGINPQQEGIYLKQYVGLIMFGPIARESLGVTREQMLSMNHVEQALQAVKMWEYIESWGDEYKISDFSSLQLATFLPKYLPNKGKLDVSPRVKKQNYPFLDKNGDLTRQSILQFYQKKSINTKELAYFRTKFMK